MTSLDGFRAVTHLVEVAMNENANCFRIERRSSCCSARFSALFEIVFEDLPEIRVRFKWRIFVGSVFLRGSHGLEFAKICSSFHISSFELVMFFVFTDGRAAER